MAGIATALLAALLPVAAAWRLAAVAAIALQAARAWRACRGVRFVALGRDGAIALALRDGRVARGRVRAGSFVAPWLVIVRWRAEGARRDRTFLLLPGMARADDLRRLRVILRWA